MGAPYRRLRSLYDSFGYSRFGRKDYEIERQRPANTVAGRAERGEGGKRTAITAGFPLRRLTPGKITPWRASEEAPAGLILRRPLDVAHCNDLSSQTLRIFRIRAAGAWKHTTDSGLNGSREGVSAPLR
jgi:hypothetical protein